MLNIIIHTMKHTNQNTHVFRISIMIKWLSIYPFDRSFLWGLRLLWGIGADVRGLTPLAPSKSAVAINALWSNQYWTTCKIKEARQLKASAKFCASITSVTGHLVLIDVIMSWLIYTDISPLSGQFLDTGAVLSQYRLDLTLQLALFS